MTSIVFTAEGADAQAEVNGKLTAGMVGVRIRFELDEAWKGLNVIATFEGSGALISVPLLSYMEGAVPLNVQAYRVIDTDVPWEVLQKANTRLRIGLEGRLNDGTIVIPTVWARAGYIEAGALATGEEANQPTPGIYDQIMAAIEDGKLKGEKGDPGEQGPAGPAGPTGATGPAGPQGEKGETPVIADDLYTKDSTKALSANMGAVLREKIDTDLLGVQKELQAEIKQRVKTVNGVAPDENGNVVVEGGTGGVAVETDPTVPAWAKQPNKPTYTASEVGALPSSTVIPTVPSALKNPHALTFTGAVEATYDGSGPVSVVIPQPGSGGSGEPGADGFSPVATVTQTGSGAVISITDKSGTTTANVYNGKDGKDGYTPVKGVDYFDGVPGKDGVDGKDGAQGIQGEQGPKGDTGAPGANGKDGVSATHSWNGTTLTITSASGTSSANLKGDKGDKGDQGIQGIQGEKGETGAAGSNGTNGKDGANGTSVTVKSVSESTADGGSNVVTFSDGKTLTVKNGRAGTDGKDGDDGYTPVRGKDYWTSADKAEIEAYIATELAKRGQLAPEYADSIDKCTDTTKLYVLPDGFIYAWMLTEKEVDSGPTYTNRLPQAVKSGGGEYVGDNGEDGYRVGYRVSSSGTEKAATGYDCIGFIPGVAGDTVRIKNVTQLNNTTNLNAYAVAYFFTSGFVKTSGAVDLELDTTFSDGVYTFTIPDYADIAYFRMSLVGVSADTIITVNEEIAEGGGTEIVKEYAWTSTGHAFVPADYEPRIIDLEQKSVNHTSRIVALEKAVVTGGADETLADALNRIKVWDKPVYDDARITLLGDDRIKPALTAEDRTIEAIYAKYRALRDDPDHPENSLYITESNLGSCTISDLVPGFTGKDILRFDFCEPAGITEVDDPSTPKVPDPARETKPKLIFLSGIHKEWAGVYGLYYALEEIANNPEFEDIRRNAHIIVIPCANPFGLIAEYTTTTNGWAAPSDWGAPSHVNANGIAPHNNFGVGYKANQNVIGSYNHSGSESYSELETQYIDQVMSENPDAIAFVTCHNYNNGGVFGYETIWASSATYHMCNLTYRLVDKLSKAWIKKYGNSLKQSIDSIKTNVSASEYRLGRATMSTSAGTEQANATKYGILATNLEISDKWIAFSKTQFSSETMTHGAEVYANFIRTILRAYDHKDKKEYAPNLPWSE